MPDYRVSIDALYMMRNTREIWAITLRARSAARKIGDAQEYANHKKDGRRLAGSYVFWKGVAKKGRFFQPRRCPNGYKTRVDTKHGGVYLYRFKTRIGKYITMRQAITDAWMIFAQNLDWR